MCENMRNCEAVQIYTKLCISLDTYLHISSYESLVETPENMRHADFCKICDTMLRVRTTDIPDCCRQRDITREIVQPVDSATASSRPIYLCLCC